MKKRKLSLLFALISSAFLISGCEKQDKNNAQDVSFDLLSSSAEQNEIDTIQQDMTPPPTELTSESTTQEQTSNTAQVSASEATSAPEELLSATLTTITKTFEPAENWTSDISFQMPENWSYSAYEPSEPDWGFTIQVQKREDAFINIFGQYGTLQADSSESPKNFTTSSGLTGKLYPNTYTDSGITYINYQIVFDLESYGVNINMPESVYNENKELIEQLFQSIAIKDNMSE